VQDIFNQFIELLRHVDTYLESFIKDHGTWVYVLLFAIIFVETGLVIMPFLPGDSLLFAVGMISARTGDLNIWLVTGLLIVAAVLGDAVNYHLGKYLGPKLFRYEVASIPADPRGSVAAGAQPAVVRKPTLFMRLLNREHLARANEFYVKYGGKAVILGRFVPIVRTFVPFVAGAGAMNYGRFVVYNVLGAILWVGSCVAAGYYLGQFDWIKKNFENVILAIIAVSLLPIGVEWFLSWKRKRKAAKSPVKTEVMDDPEESKKPPENK
jgi:membrane-associated protein